MVIMTLWEKKCAWTGMISFKVCVLKIEQIHKMLSDTSSTDCYFMRCMPFHCSTWHLTFACLNYTLLANSVLLTIIWTWGMCEQSGFNSCSAIQNFKVRSQWGRKSSLSLQLILRVKFYGTSDWLHLEKQYVQSRSHYCWMLLFICIYLF